MGVKLGYKHTDGHLGNVSFKIDDDVNFTLKELKLKEELYNCTFFHSSYIGLDPGKRFGLFNENQSAFGIRTFGVYKRFGREFEEYQNEYI